MIYIGSDHRGYALKEKLKLWLASRGIEHEDCGALTYDKDDDYPVYAKAVGEKVASHAGNHGILICGSGEGIAIAANKIDGIRAGTCSSPEQAMASVNDEDLNVLALSADYLTEDQVHAITKAFLEARFSGAERHKRRITEIDALEGGRHE
ncbi:MAG: hypothetical protein A3A33_02140 [Candidatus Yanofskybacteria bacterium RIFCSPLOWO2_01_FULL_49_25]|uniref:Ribose-5-phosphate isomerase n=1 Tax=Candidatus Yanofskybacteria bacterium RIFCSPLOWO2_01_FULL_49_25 TaxID=1802701 RepID=A0A1F8GRT3_9BACT|nr:MAG: hypothetical protein A3A33_02140 [Candidatus Yanofskybacteria bacterium RIFCSPLOWO2_01_FULL_49_25]